MENLLIVGHDQNGMANTPSPYFNERLTIDDGHRFEDYWELVETWFFDTKFKDLHEDLVPLVENVINLTKLTEYIKDNDLKQVTVVYAYSNAYNHDKLQGFEGFVMPVHPTEDPYEDIYEKAIKYSKRNCPGGQFMCVMSISPF